MILRNKYKSNDDCLNVSLTKTTVDIYIYTRLFFKSERRYFYDFKCKLSSKRTGKVHVTKYSSIT